MYGLQEPKYSSPISCIVASCWEDILQLVVHYEGNNDEVLVKRNFFVWVLPELPFGFVECIVKVEVQ